MRFGSILRRWTPAALLVGALATGLALAVEKIQDPHTLPLRVVRIDGEFRHLDRQELERVVAARARDGFFTVDAEAVRAAALALPWVEEASVRRIWPDTLRMWVKEQEPLARWGKKQLVNPHGELFEPKRSEIPAGLPWLNGPPESAPETVALYSDLQQRLQPLGLRIARLQQDDRGAWSVVFANGAVIKLGNKNREQRLARFIRLYPQLTATDHGSPQLVDLRYTNGFVVHWEQPATGQQPQGAAPKNQIGRKEADPDNKKAA